MEDVKKWLERLRDVIVEGELEGLSHDELNDLVKYVLWEIAKKENSDIMILLAKITKYLMKNSKVCRKYIRAMNAWLSLVGSRRYSNVEIIHSMIYDLRCWLEYCYEEYKFAASPEAEKIRDEVKKALEAVEIIGKKLCSKWKKLVYSIKWTTISTSRTNIVGGVCKINIGLGGIIENAVRHKLYEYVRVGIEIFKNPKHGSKGTVYIDIAPGDESVIPWFIVAHEAAHCLSEFRHGTRKNIAGRRRVHDIYFIEAYKQILREMAKYNPLIAKYVKL